MSLAKLLAVIDGGSGSEAALIAALNLGRRFSAQVELLHVEIDADSAVPMVGEGMSGVAVEQLVQSLRAEAEQRRERARGLYEKHCVAAGLNVVDADFVPRTGPNQRPLHPPCRRPGQGSGAEAPRSIAALKLL